MTRITVLLFGFLLGCAAAPLVVPQLRAQQTQVTRWEYTCLSDRGSPNMDAWNEYGSQGWELTFRSHDEQICFKRPL